MPRATVEAPKQPAGRQGESSVPLALGQEKLAQLTSLRFFAAAMVFIYHLSAMFGFYSTTFLNGMALTQGVSFFFVMSGYILSYVHPNLQTPAEANRFMLARFARIWPTHFVTFLLTCFLVPIVLAIPHVFPVAIANLLMLQSWSFVYSISTSFNSVSWSISVELFFYLSFPFLIKDFHAPIKYRWIAAFLLSAGCIAMYAIMCTTTTAHISSAVYVIDNPLARIAEFTLGMATCWLFKKYGMPVHIKRFHATAIELLLVASVILSLNIGNLWTGSNVPGALWALHAVAMPMAGAPIFAALIFVMAGARGLVSDVLKHKFLVRLGETSFALYMVHMAILNYATLLQNHFANLPGFVLPTIATIICFIVAELCFVLIEDPARKYILDRTGTKAKKPPIGDAPHIVTHDTKKTFNGLKTISVAAQCVMVAGLAYWMTHQFRFISNSTADKIVKCSVPASRDVNFGDRFRLRGLKISHSSNQIRLHSVWQSLLDQKMTCGVVISTTNAQGKELSRTMVAQDNFAGHVSRGKLWEDDIIIPAEKLSGCGSLGVAIYDPINGTMLTVRGKTDGIKNGSELLVALP